MAKTNKDLTNKEQVPSQTEQDEKEKRISVAVMFLQNPEVQKMNKQSIIGFLKKKKLSDAEIEEAQNRLKEKIENQKKQEQEEKQKQQEQVELEKKQKLKVFDTYITDQIKINQDYINLQNTGITQLTDEQNSQLNPIILNVSFNTQFNITDMNKFDRLERLYISGCNLRFVNPKFIPLQLKILNLSHNYLISMEFVELLVNIELLNLSFNQIDQIVKLEGLTKLYHLNLKQNLIYEIPKNQPLGQLKYLVFFFNLLLRTQSIIQQMILTIYYLLAIQRRFQNLNEIQQQIILYLYMNQERNSAFKNICTTRGGLEHEQQMEFSLHESGRLSGQQQPQLYNFMERDSLNKQYYRDDEYLERKSAKSQMSLEEQFQKFSIQSRQSNFMLFNRASFIQPKSSLGYGSQKPSIEFSQKNSIEKYQRFSNGSQSMRLSNRSSSQPQEQQSLEIVMEWQDNEENPQVIEELIKKLTLEKQSEYRPDRLSIQPQQKQGCICKRTQCLKFYCQCFQAGKLCTDSCECVDCCNNDKNQQILEQTKQQIIQKNPEAFQPIEILKACSCKKSRCLKKYCECYHNGQRCGDQCKCEGCENKIEDKQELLRPPQELYPPYGKKVQLSRIEF